MHAADVVVPHTREVSKSMSTMWALSVLTRSTARNTYD